MITYNHAPFITRAIEGVLKQETNFPFELVIGEDCSTDGTREIVLGYEKSHPGIIRVITSGKNVGSGKNGYRTEKACSGKYVAWCEGDDYWHNPGKLQKQADYMESHPSCGLIHSDYDRHIVKTAETIRDFNKIKNNIPSDNLDVSRILRGGKYLYILTCTVMTRREILFEVLDGDPDLYQHGKFLIGDTPRWAEIAWRSGTHYMNESLATYTVLQGSASKKNDPVKVLNFGKSNSELFLYLAKKYGLQDYELDYYTKKWCQYTIQLAFTKKDVGLAREARKLKQHWSPKEHILYLGINSAFLNRVIKATIYIKNKLPGVFKYEYASWAIRQGHLGDKTLPPFPG